MVSRVHDVGSVNDFKSGRTYPMTIEGRPIVIVRKENTFFAIRDICPHQGAFLSTGKVSGSPRRCLPGDEIVLDQIGEILICPWHGWEFDLNNGRTLAESGQGRAKTYPIELKEDRVMITLA